MDENKAHQEAAKRMAQAQAAGTILGAALTSLTQKPVPGSMGAEFAKCILAVFLIFLIAGLFI